MTQRSTINYLKHSIVLYSRFTNWTHVILSTRLLWSRPVSERVRGMHALFRGMVRWTKELRLPPVSARPGWEECERGQPHWLLLCVHLRGLWALSHCIARGISWLMGRLNGWLLFVGGLVDEFDRPIDQSIHWLIDWLIDWLVGCLVDWLFECLRYELKIVPPSVHEGYDKMISLI